MKIKPFHFALTVFIWLGGVLQSATAPAELLWSIPQTIIIFYVTMAAMLAVWWLGLEGDDDA